MLLLFEVASAEPVRLSGPPRITPPDELTAWSVVVGPPAGPLLVTTPPATVLEQAVLTSPGAMDFPPFSLSFFLEDDLRTSRRSLSLSDKRRRKRTSD